MSYWGFCKANEHFVPPFDIGIDADALAKAIAAVGNYGEIYDRYMGPDGDAFTLPRGPNELWSNGGLIYAPPVK